MQSQHLSGPGAEYGAAAWINEGKRGQPDQQFLSTLFLLVIWTLFLVTVVRWEALLLKAEFGLKAHSSRDEKSQNLSFC